MIRHFKDKDIRIGQELNDHIHSQGGENPPVHVKVKVYKFKDKLIADTIDAPVMKEEEKKKGVTEKIKETITGKKEETKSAQEEKQEETKREVMKHPPGKKEEKEAPREGAPKEQKAGERTHKAGVFSKTQKPKHEKKK